MAVRFFGALGVFSMIIAFIIVLISYAGFPNDVLVYLNGPAKQPTYIAKGNLFYILLAFLLVFNIAFLGLKTILQKNEQTMELTQTGLMLSQIFYNLFFASSVYFINILNSRENFNYSNFGYLIYVTGGLLAGSIVFSLIARYVLKK